MMNDRSIFGKNDTPIEVLIGIVNSCCWLNWLFSSFFLLSFFFLIDDDELL